MPEYLRLPALVLWKSAETKATVRSASRKRVQCPQCNGFRRALYILPSLVICCAACLRAEGMDVTRPERLPTPKEIAATRRRLQELAPLSAPFIEPPVPAAPVPVAPVPVAKPKRRRPKASSS